MSIVQGLTQLFKRRGAFFIVGLTGRTGSGCSTAAELLCREFSNLPLDPVASPLATPEDRKYRIIRQYANSNWMRFRTVSVTQTILTFALDSDSAALNVFLRKYLKDSEREAFSNEVARIAEIWKTVKMVIEKGPRKIATETAQFLEFWDHELKNLLNICKRTLGANYPTVFQIFGDNLRSSGSVLDSTFVADKIYQLPERVAEIIVALRELDIANGQACRVAIDALRNPFEIQYFRQRFAPFYLIAITTPDNDRKSRLQVRQGMTLPDIKKLDMKEYPSQNKPLGGENQFVSQNIQACIEKADIFVRNEGTAKEGASVDLKDLAKQLLMFTTLMQHPGLITPSKTERCMQIAYSAKANSGCLSRQVGAAVSDQHYSIRSVGWNDVPAGQISCLLRSASDLLDSNDEMAFSDYELEDDKFRKHLAGRYKIFNVASAEGRSPSFCFKSEYNALEKKNNQVHTRSLHAEENAFLQISKYGGVGLENGILFSTASPCELCSKKAFQLGIKKIYYIDPYPGISMSHILGSGNKAMRPKVELFFGAVGQAFHRLYDPILPSKDETEVFLAPEKQDPVANLSPQSSTSSLGSST